MTSVRNGVSTLSILLLLTASVAEAQTVHLVRGCRQYVIHA